MKFFSVDKDTTLIVLKPGQRVMLQAEGKDLRFTVKHDELLSATMSMHIQQERSRHRGSRWRVRYREIGSGSQKFTVGCVTKDLAWAAYRQQAQDSNVAEKQLQVKTRRSHMFLDFTEES